MAKIDNRAKINPKMMKWARIRAGYVGEYENRLPKEIKANYKLWESGKRNPTWNQLAKVSKKYNLATAFFFMGSPPNESSPELIDYRDKSSKRQSPELILNIRRSIHRREIYDELLDDFGRNKVNFKNYNGELDVDKVSLFIHKSLDLSLNKQKSWIKNKTIDYNHYNFLNNWKTILNEKFGILTFETEDVEINEMRGLCIHHNKTPVILLNGKDSVNGRIFTLFHELTHLLLGKSALCGIYIDKKEEIFCNAVAGKFLVPTDDLKINCRFYKDLTSNYSLNKLSHTYGVSKEVILRRLLDLGKISKYDYNGKLNQFRNNIYLKNTKSGGNYLNNQIKYNGKSFLSLVLEAYESNIISISDFCNFTNLNQKFIEELESKLWSVE